jgi:glycosyltransferase involved in cell wall biosynthesis
LESAGEALLGVIRSVIEKGGLKNKRNEIARAPLTGATSAPEVAIRADWRSPSGLGQAARNLHSGLAAAGLRPAAVWVPKDAIQNIHLWPGEVELFRERADLWIHTLPPDHYDLSLPGKHVGLFFWETDQLPDGKSGGAAWREKLNRLDEIWVATPFLVDVLGRSGISRPVRVVPLPLNTDRYAPGPRRLPRMEYPKGYDPSWTVVLYTGTWDPRKRPDLLVRAFTRAFGQEDRAVLLLKCYVTGHEDQDRDILERWVAECRAGSGHVRILPQILDEDEMAGLFRSATFFATASRGEGFCLPAVQALSSGKPVMGVQWSALADLVSVPVRHRVENVPREVNLPGYSPAHRWAAIDLDHLAEQLKWAHLHRREVADLGRKGREWALSTLSLGVAGARLRAHVEELLSVPVHASQEGALV